MGVSIAWVAVRTDSAESLLDELQVLPTGEPVGLYESPICGAVFNGWFLIVARGSDHRLISDSFLAQLSRGREVVACSIEEHVMFSSAASWREGRRIWSIVHDAERGMLDLRVTGRPPQAFDEVRADVLAQQEVEGGAEAEVDFVFEVPLRVAESIVGFKHDENTMWSDRAAFESYQDVKRPWWRFW